MAKQHDHVASIELRRQDLEYECRSLDKAKTLHRMADLLDGKEGVNIRLDSCIDVTDAKGRVSSQSINVSDTDGQLRGLIASWLRTQAERAWKP